MAGAPVLTPALIVGSLRYGETSRIVRLLTADLGMVSAIAKGALRPRSRFGAALQLLSEGQAHLLPSRGGELHTMTAFDLAATHAGLASHLGRFRAATALAETVVRFVPPTPNPGLYWQLQRAVSMLELAPPEAIEVLGLRALWQLIATLGLAPALEECARDGVAVPPGSGVFSMGDGGFLCRGCAQGSGATRMAAEDREALAALLAPSGELPVLDPPHAAAHRRLLARWVMHHLAEGAMPALESWRRGGE